MKNLLQLLLLALLSKVVFASDMVHSFKSPMFNGVGFSSHQITIENLSRTRKQSVKDQAKADAETAKVTAQNTPLNAFINNLQARIYSQLASQVTDAIFNSSGANFGIINLEGGSTVTWQKNGDMVTLYIVDSATGNTTTIQVPVGTLNPGGG